MKFRLTGGSHVAGDRSYKKGDVIESDKDLVKIFVNKFERLHDEDTPVSKGTQIDVPGQAPRPAEAEEEAAEVEGLGVDVSAEFPEAAEADVLVFKAGKLYTVADADEPTKALNVDALTSKKAVKEYITKKFLS